MELWTALSSHLGLAVTTGGFLLIGYLIYSCAYAPFQVLKQCGIKGPQPLPFYGSYKEIRKLGILNFCEELCEKYGPVCGYYLGQRPHVVVADVEILKQVTVKEFDSFVDREHLPNIFGWKRNTPCGLAQAKGGTWKTARQIISPTFSAAKMKSMASFVKSSCDTLVEILGVHSGSGKSLDVFRAYSSFSLETILAFVFGRVVNIQRGETDQFTDACESHSSSLLEGHDYADWMVVLLTNFPCLTHLSHLLFRRIVKESVMEILHTTTLHIVQTRREEGKSKHKDLLQLMLDAAGGEGGKEEKLTDEEIVVHCITFLLAGYDTTANTLAYTSYLLALNPEVQEKLQAEIDEYFESNPETSMYSATQELQYLDMVVQESLRMYPASPRNARHCQKTVEINGVTIPKGATVQLPIHLLHYNPEFWPEPEKFDPERFTPEEKAKRPALCHMPFGWGPRNCIGMRFALMEAKMALIEILKKYTFVQAPETEVPLKTFNGGAIMAPQNGVYLRITRRD